MQGNPQSGKNPILPAGFSPWPMGVVSTWLVNMARTLEDVFRDFCVFGAKGSPSLMEGAKFAKLCRDMKLLDKNVSSTEVDIIFQRAKP